MTESSKRELNRNRNREKRKKNRQRDMKTIFKGLVEIKKTMKQINEVTVIL